MADDLLPTSDATAQAVMATGVSAPPPAKKPDDITSLLPTKEQHEGAKAGLESAYKKHEEELGGMIREGDEAYKRGRARMEQAVKQEGATIEELKHGTWNAQKELSDRKVDIWEQFGSPGFLIAMLASSFSAMPMNSALNAGAAAMNAVQQGKMDEYRKAFDVWKANTDLVIQRQAMEHQVYEDINKLMTSDLARWREKFLVANARFGDERMRVLAENDMLPEIDQAFSAKATAISQVALAKDKIEESGMRTMFVNAQEGVWRDGPNGQKVPNPQAWQAAVDLWHNMGDAERSSYDKFVLETWQNTRASPTDSAIREHMKETAEARYPYRAAGGPPTKEKEIVKIQADLKKEHRDWDEAKTYAEATKQVEKAHKVLTANEAARQGSHVEQYDLALTDILPQAESILRKHVGAAGAAGYATRAAESVSNVFGGNDTDRRQFESDIEELRLMGPTMLLDRATGRPLTAEHDLIDKIIRGLNMGDTTANTLRSLEELKNRLTRLRGAAATRKEDPFAQASPATAPRAAPAASWDEYPEVK